MTGWWVLDDSQCLSWYSTENKSLLLGMEYQTSYQQLGHIFIALPFTDCTIMHHVLSVHAHHASGWLQLIELLWVISYT